MVRIDRLIARDEKSPPHLPCIRQKSQNSTEKINGRIIYIKLQNGGRHQLEHLKVQTKNSRRHSKQIKTRMINIKLPDIQISILVFANCNIQVCFIKYMGSSTKPQGGLYQGRCNVTQMTAERRKQADPRSACLRVNETGQRIKSSCNTTPIHSARVNTHAVEPPLQALESKANSIFFLGP